MIITLFAKLIAQLVKIILINRWFLIIFKPRALLIPPLCSVKKQEELKGSPLLYPSPLSGTRAVILRVLAGVALRTLAPTKLLPPRWKWISGELSCIQFMRPKNRGRLGRQFRG